MAEGCIGVHLRHHQRHTLFHAEGTGVVDHHSAGIRDRLTPLLRHRATSRGKHQIHTLEGCGTHLLNDQLLTLPLLFLPRRAGRCQQAQFSNRKLTLVEQLEQLLTHSSAGTEHRNGQRAGGERTRTRWRRRGGQTGIARAEKRIQTSSDCIGHPL